MSELKIQSPDLKSFEYWKAQAEFYKKDRNECLEKISLLERKLELCKEQRDRFITRYESPMHFELIRIKNKELEDLK